MERRRSPEMGVVVARHLAVARHCPSSQAAWGEGWESAVAPDCCARFHGVLGVAGPASEAVEGLTDEAQERPAVVATVERETVEGEDLRSCGSLTTGRLSKIRHRSSPWSVC